MPSLVVVAALHGVEDPVHERFQGDRALVRHEEDPIPDADQEAIFREPVDPHALPRDRTEDGGHPGASGVGQPEREGTIGDKELAPLQINFWGLKPPHNLGGPGAPN